MVIFKCKVDSVYVPKGNRDLVTFKEIYYVPKNRSFVKIDEF